MIDDPATPECDLVELRRYTLHSGRHETHFELFDREFVEAQEALGMTVMAAGRPSTLRMPRPHQ